MKFIGKESVVLEFKQEIPKNSQIIRTAIGFCNSFGGKLVVGVEDDGVICGVSEEGIDEMMDSIQESIYKNCTPPILPAVYTQRYGDKIVVIVEVSAGMNKPYFLSKKGMQEGTYIRLGSHTYKADHKMIEELQWASRGLAVDTLPVYQATIDDIDQNRVKAFLNARKQSHQDIDVDSALTHYKLVTTEHTRVYPTLAGLLLFGKSPQQFITEAFIICSHFKGTSGRDAMASIDCEGDLFMQFEQSMNFLMKHLEKSFKITGVKREETLEIPLEALREVILNAIVHRHYQIPGPSKIAIYDDRVEVFTPGNFPGPLLPNQLEMGYTFIRNQVITKIFRELGYIEKLGSGLITLFQSYRERKLAIPQVIEGDNFVKYILPRKSPAADIEKSSDYELEIILMFNKVEELTVKDIIKEIPISRQTASRMLNKLIEKKLVKRIGKSSATRYRKEDKS